MPPNPIKSVGKVREEPRVETSRERTSEAFRMAVSGESSSAEHIAMIDARAAAGEITDDLAHEIRAEIGEIIGEVDGYTFSEFVGALAGGAADVASDDGFRLSFDFQKKGFDSIREMAAKYRKDYAGKARKNLSPKDRSAFKATVVQIMRDPTMSRDAMLRAEVDRAMSLVRRMVMDRLGLKEKSAVEGIVSSGGLGQMIPGIEPLEVSGEDGDFDSPSDVHMDIGSLEKAVSESLGVPASLMADDKKHGDCRCGGKCHSRGG